MITPQPLRKGDTVAFIAPSSGLAKTFEYRVKRAENWFKSQGFKVVYARNFWKKGFLAGTPEESAEALNELIQDKEVRALISLIGGEHSIQLLRYIDFKAFRKNPKIFTGFSDITVLHLAFYTQSRVKTFYGPMILTQFGEYPEPHKYTIEYFYRAVSSQRIGKIRPTSYTDQFLDWGKYKNKKRTNYKKNHYVWIKKGEAKGELVGGCLPSILRLAGTRYFPNLKNKLLFLETPEGDKPGTPYDLERAISDIVHLMEMEIFEKIRGLVLGIPYRYSEKMKEKLYISIKNLLGGYDFPILANVNFGHTDPIITIPYGALARISSKRNEFVIVNI